MHLFFGTSGYSYKEWKGSFYPEKLRQDEMLGYYAERFGTVEINATFYRMPTMELLKAWAADVPATFRFVLKAPELITHRKRLNGADEPTAKFVEVTSVLKHRLGPMLFQLPPNFKKDVTKLGSFLALVRKLTKGRKQIAFEFRHGSWFDEEVFACLRVHRCALCVADADEGEASPELLATADWGYVRLRREVYSAAALRKWIMKIKAQPWKEAYVFFKHEDSGTGPKFARKFVELASG
jgi:uncharacterized protein YecE (DUF72 family)